MTILVLQRGWSVIGEGRIEAGEWRLDGSAVIRRWGTTRGIGQLALYGPQPDTQIDPCGTVRAHELAVVMAIEVTEESEGKWRERLAGEGVR